ncbi:unnamed protein product [Chondrus crispus]|uniref:Uncharacterized protein n=1 Tax=Chondrus crispus TaxID=2769 RepID=R7QC83_CHOCR|nr:unnamed protein product [Chondrus crispus]CDF35398.1 unnamed protein product [Chondrus crispus]|eukprot:XP_005715217.1 unnamed protein product [Chondrus crispus]
MDYPAFVPCPIPLLAHHLRRPCCSTDASRPQCNDKVNPQLPIAARIPAPSSLANITPSSAALPNRKCALLWLRLGHLRLADNLAVRAAAYYDGPVLPVVTIKRGEVCEAVMAAVASVASRFQALGSAIVLRIVDNHCQSEGKAVSDVADIVRTKLAFVNEYHGVNDLDLQPCRQAGLTLRVCCDEIPHYLSRAHAPESSTLCEAPRSFPRLPQVARKIGLHLSCSGKPRCAETAARVKLARILHAGGPGRNSAPWLPYLLGSLHQELHTGCLSRPRVVYELRRVCNTGASVGTGAQNSIKSFFNRFRKTPAIASLSIAAFDVNGGDRRGVEWDEETKSFRLKEWEHKEPERRMNPKERWHEFWRRRRMFFTRSFFPDDVTPDYYSFTAWRFSQRCVSATIGVFGTSSLLFALGIRSGRIGQAAVISWVLKDGLGRVGKMLWAGSMGKDFDVDPKRWRFRSALLYALGNGLEIVTQIFPASFLVFATLANSMKQVSMLTSSATRNAMYRSFGGVSQNIANITAKGEAQIVVADLIGMACGIRLSKVFGTSKEKVLVAYLILTALDIFGIYMELRQVVFRTLNAERSNILVKRYVRSGALLAPSDVSPQERIFLKPHYKSELRLSSIANAAADPQELDMLLHVFRKEHFLVSVPNPNSGNQCRIVLRKNASNEDVMRAILMTGYVRKALNGRTKTHAMTLDEQESLLRSSWRSARKNFPAFLESAKRAGWSTENLLFGTMKRRGYWGH